MHITQSHGLIHVLIDNFTVNPKFTASMTPLLLWDICLLFARLHTGEHKCIIYLCNRMQHSHYFHHHHVFCLFGFWALLEWNSIYKIETSFFSFQLTYDCVALLRFRLKYSRRTRSKMGDHTKFEDKMNHRKKTRFLELKYNV